MRIYPASHYTMGGLWVDYELMTTIPGLYCAGEANFSDHGANRLGASALMQGLADGYFVLPYTIGNYLAPMLNKPIPGTDHPEFAAAERAARARFDGYLAHRRHPLARPLPPRARQDHLGLLRHGAQRAGPGEGAVGDPRAVRGVPDRTCASPATATSVNQTLEKAGRVDDFFQLGMLMCRDALERRESCGGHFRSEYQTEEGEALRDDEQLRPRRGVGVDRRPDDGHAPPGGARVRDRPLPDPELQVSDADRIRNLTLKIWRQDGPDAAGRFETHHDRRDQRGGVVPRAARRAQRAADRRGQGSDRLRPRLPRGHLRHVLADDQRPGPRPAAGHGDVPAAHAQVRRRRRDRRRAVAGAGVPDHQGPDGRPRRRSTASSRPAASSPRRPAARPTPT